MEVPVPLYNDLPETSRGYRCSWAYFNSLSTKGRRRDNIGTLNFLTPERRVAAASEIVTGKSISLDLPIDYFAPDISAFGGRAAPVHTIKQAAPFAYEDTLSFNTQSASQWDGLRHFAIRSSGKFYNGYEASDLANSNILSIDSFLDGGGICGRGVLVDFAAWSMQMGKPVDPNSGYPITLSDVLAVLAFQKTIIRPGDVLVFRTGWLWWYQNTGAGERHTELCIRHEPGKHSFVGLAPERDLVEWLWNNQIAAVAGDGVALECTPPPSDGFGWLHEHLLACLGCPIGELWDTEELGKECERSGRYTFYLVSVPLCLKGGVASPSNAVAIF